MYLDTKEYPKDYILTEVVSRAVGCFVNLASFHDHGDHKVFRILTDSFLEDVQLSSLMSLIIKDHDGEKYAFSHIESITGPVIDKSPHLNKSTLYFRLTYVRLV